MLFTLWLLLLLLFSVGGVVIEGCRGRITCNNTLEERVNVMVQGLLPQVRTLLFGARPKGQAKVDGRTQGKEEEKK